jgi:hypothetical protein
MEILTVTEPFSAQEEKGRNSTWKILTDLAIDLL